MFELMDLMRAQGHEVALFAMADPRGLPTPYDAYFVPNIDFKSPQGVFTRAKHAFHRCPAAAAAGHRRISA
jgi:hypothetical protein